MPTTSLGIRYPAGTDSANVAQYYQNLASDVNGLIGPKSRVNVPLAGGWTSTPQYYKDAAGIVYLTGQVVNTATFTPGGDLIGTLPLGFRPIFDTTFPVFNSAVYSAFVRVTTTGRVEAFRSQGNVSVGANSVWTLDPVRYPTV